MEMKMLDARDPLPERLGKDDMCGDDLDENDTPSRKQLSRATLAWRRTMLACTKIVKVISGFYWDGKSTWWIDGMLTEKARQCEEEDRLTHKEERRMMGRCWVELDGDQLIDIEDKVADTLSESGIEGDMDEIEVL